MKQAIALVSGVVAFEGIPADRQWPQDHLKYSSHPGFYVHPNVTLSDHTGLRGFFANGEIDGEAELFFLPDSMSLSNKSNPDIEEAVDAHPGGDRAVHAKVALAVLRELRKGDESVWKTYLDDIPRDMSNVLQMSPTQQELMFTLLATRSSRNVYKYSLEVVKDLQGKLGISPLADDDEIKWAIGVVTTRCIGHSRLGTALVPYYDLLNHPANYTLATGISTQNAYRDGVPGMSITANGFTQAGDELFNSYGQKPNARMWLSYGFQMPDNPVGAAVYFHGYDGWSKGGWIKGCHGNRQWRMAMKKEESVEAIQESLKAWRAFEAFEANPTAAKTAAALGCFDTLPEHLGGEKNEAVDTYPGLKAFLAAADQKAYKGLTEHWAQAYEIRDRELELIQQLKDEAPELEGKQKFFNDGTISVAEEEHRWIDSIQGLLDGMMEKTEKILVDENMSLDKEQMKTVGDKFVEEAGAQAKKLREAEREARMAEKRRQREAKRAAQGMSSMSILALLAVVAMFLGAAKVLLAMVSAETEKKAGEKAAKAAAKADKKAAKAAAKGAKTA